MPSQESIPDELQQELKDTECKLSQKAGDYKNKMEKIQSQLQQKKLRTGKLDCAIVMDLTSSMNPYIEKMKKQLCNLIVDIKKNNKDLDICFAFVGYKDFCDSSEINYHRDKNNLIECQTLITSHISINDFSSDLENFQEFLKKMFASGGGDIPEDVTGALYQSLQLSWRIDSFKIVVLVSDAPTHGTQYQSQFFCDDYSTGHPFGIILEDVVLQYAKIKAMFLIFKLNDSTEKMFQIIKEQMKSRQAKTRFIDLQQVFKRKEEKKFKEEQNFDDSSKKFKTKKTKKPYIFEEDEVYFSDDVDTKQLHKQLNQIKMSQTPYFFQSIQNEIQWVISDEEDKNNSDQDIDENQKSCLSLASYVNIEIANKINYDSEYECLSQCLQID